MKWFIGLTEERDKMQRDLNIAQGAWDEWVNKVGKVIEKHAGLTDESEAWLTLDDTGEFIDATFKWKNQLLKEVAELEDVLLEVMSTTGYVRIEGEQILVSDWALPAYKNALDFMVRRGLAKPGLSAREWILIFPKGSK